MIIFFFKQKTAYDMRISDCSSDVCSSDLRETYLGEQHDDLHGALETLEEAIKKIDIETKELFKQTFDKVDAVFRDRFPKLFGGGEAYLELDRKSTRLNSSH